MRTLTKAIAVLALTFLAMQVHAQSDLPHIGMSLHALSTLVGGAGQHAFKLEDLYPKEASTIAKGKRAEIDLYDIVLLNGVTGNVGLIFDKMKLKEVDIVSRNSFDTFVQTIRGQVGAPTKEQRYEAVWVTQYGTITVRDSGRGFVVLVK